MFEGFSIEIPYFSWKYQNTKILIFLLTHYFLKGIINPFYPTKTPSISASWKSDVEKGKFFMLAGHFWKIRVPFISYAAVDYLHFWLAMYCFWMKIGIVRKYLYNHNIMCMSCVKQVETCFILGGDDKEIQLVITLMVSCKYGDNIMKLGQ